jgi:Osmosensitive K+ channel histidine kinase
MIYCDRLRLNQVIDNIINNSYKYANTDIEVRYQEREKDIVIEIRDYGTNFQPADLPLIFEKYYRGGNASHQSGTGLGLYLAKLFMEGMNGEIECKVDQGFVVILTIKKV